MFVLRSLWLFCQGSWFGYPGYFSRGELWAPFGHLVVKLLERGEQDWLDFNHMLYYIILYICNYRWCTWRRLEYIKYGTLFCPKDKAGLEWVESRVWGLKPRGLLQIIREFTWAGSGLAPWNIYVFDFASHAIATEDTMFLTVGHGRWLPLHSGHDSD